MWLHAEVLDTSSGVCLALAAPWQGQHSVHSLAGVRLCSRVCLKILCFQGPSSRCNFIDIGAAAVPMPSAIFKWAVYGLILPKANIKAFLCRGRQHLTSGFPQGILFQQGFGLEILTLTGEAVTRDLRCEKR